nr:immunoglobulin light chain junction region [Mus musculus]NSM01801.1 immunoglobulin light chain junction region [Mus musculus]NSM02057.1 immunoglobulin light chain junction region [Mus musculus]
CQQNNEEPLTF